MNNILSKSPSTWILAIATGLGAYGGFPEAPQWWQDIAKTKVFQFFTLAVLVYQGGGNSDLVWTLVVSVILFTIMELSKKIEAKQQLQPQQQPQQKQQQQKQQ